MSFFKPDAPLTSPQVIQLLIYILCFITGPCAVGGIGVVIYMISNSPYSGLTAFALSVVAVVDCIPLVAMAITSFWLIVAMTWEYCYPKKTRTP